MSLVGVAQAQSLSGLTLSPTELVGGTSSTGTVTLSDTAGLGGFTVYLSSNSANATVPASIVVPAGATTTQFAVTTRPVTSDTAPLITARDSNYKKFSATLTIHASSLAAIRISPAVVTGGSLSLGTVVLERPAPFGGAVVNLSSNNNAASVPAFVTVAAGASTASFTIYTIPVAKSVSLFITASQPNRTCLTSMSVLMEAVAGVTLAPSSVVGGNSSKGTVTLASPAPTYGLNLSLASNNSNALVPSSLYIPAGAISGSFSVKTLSSRTPAQATISASSGSSSKSVVLTINPVQIKLASLSLSPSSVIGGANSTGTVTLNAPAPQGDIHVTLASNLVTAKVPESITVPAGSTSVDFVAATTPVLLPSVPKIKATVGSSTITVTLSVNPPSQVALTLSPNSITGGGTSTGVVTLNGLAPTGGIDVSLSSSQGVTSIPSKVTVAQGSTSVSFPISTEVVLSDTPVVIKATDAHGNKSSATLTVLALVSSGLQLSPWPKFRGNLTNSGAGLGKGALGKVQWSVGKFGSSSKAVADPVGNLYVGTSNGWICAFSSSGTPKWQKYIGGSFTSPPAMSPDGTLYVFDTVTLNLDSITATGYLKWSYKFSSALGSNLAFGVDGTIYVNTYDLGLLAISPDGTKKWSVALPQSGPRSSSSFASSPVVAPDGTILEDVISTTENVSLSNPITWSSGIMALNADGTQKWSAGLGYSNYGLSVTSPTLASDGSVFVASVGILTCFDHGGTKKWQQTVEPYVSDVVVDFNGNVYVPGTRNLYSFYPNGTTRWTVQPPANSLGTGIPAIGSDGTVYWSCGNQVSAIDLSGAYKWTYSSDQPILRNLLIELDGTILAESGSSLVALSAAGSKKWAFDTKSNLTASPILSYGAIILSGDSIFNVDLNGKQVWKTYMGMSQPTSPAIALDGTVYVGSANALYAFTAQGNPKWMAPISLLSSSPAIGADGTIYIGSGDGKLYAFSPTGALKWTSQASGAIYSSPTISPKGIIYVGTYDQMCAFNSDGSVYATFGNIGSPFESSPAIGADGTVYIGSFWGRFYAFNPDLTVKWIFNTNSALVNSPPSIGADGTIYVPDGQQALFALKPDGTVKWQFKATNLGTMSVAIAQDGTLYFGSTDGNLYALDADGKQKWSFLTSGYVVCPPSVGSDGTIYVHSEDGYLYAIKPDGTMKWELMIGGYPFNGAIYYNSPVSSPAIGADGSIYIGTGMFYAIK